MAHHDRWRDEDRYRDDFGSRDFGRGEFRGGGSERSSFAGDYPRGEFRSDWERGGGYGRGGSWESGGQGYGGGRDYEPGYRSGFEGSYRGGGGGGFGAQDFERGSFRGGGGYGTPRGGSDWEIGGGYRGGGGSSQYDWDRAFGAGGYSGMRGSDWGFGRSAPDYGRWDWTRGSNFGSGDFGRGHFGDYDRDAAYGYGSRREGGYRGARSDYEREAVYGPRDERGFWDRASDEVSSWLGDEEAERRRRMDQFRGRGPKGYKRSDDRIREDISDRLTDDWRVDASDIEVSISGGEVTLTGHVDSRDAKRRAEDIAESVAGVKHVQNNLRVKDRFGESDSTFGSSTSQSGDSFGSGASRTSTPGSSGANIGESTGRRRAGA
jgi:osmotically-inducible protein OsmY